MKINEKATNIELTADIRDYLYKKLSYLKKIVDVSDDSIICDVELGKTTLHHKSGDVFKAEINFLIQGKSFYSVAETEDLYASIDKVQDDLVREIKAYKDKQLTQSRKGGAKIKDMIRGLFNR